MRSIRFRSIAGRETRTAWANSWAPRSTDCWAVTCWLAASSISIARPAAPMSSPETPAPQRRAGSRTRSRCRSARQRAFRSRSSRSTGNKYRRPSIPVPLSALPRRPCSVTRPSIGRHQDFHPGFGRFETDLHLVSIDLGGGASPVDVAAAAAPPALAPLLAGLGLQAILGGDLLMGSEVLFDFRARVWCRSVVFARTGQASPGASTLTEFLGVLRTGHVLHWRRRSSHCRLPSMFAGAGGPRFVPRQIETI